jgi:hypothetical protein
LFIKTVKNPQHLIIHSEIGPPVVDLIITMFFHQSDQFVTDFCTLITENCAVITKNCTLMTENCTVITENCTAVWD